MTRFLDRWFRREEINGNRCPTYLYRWTLFQPRRPRWLWGGFGIYVHKFVGDDWSLDLHDHPKRFISIGVKGSYREYWQERCVVEDSYHGGPIEVLTEQRSRVFKAPWLRSFPARHIHRISLLEDRQPCWTVVLVLRHQRDWGFWNGNIFHHWRSYVAKGNQIADARKACP